MAFKRYLILIGLILFALILGSVNLTSVFFILKEANFIFLLFSFSILFFMLTIKAKKWQILLNVYGSSLSLFSCLKFWCIGFFLSILTPGRVGDFSRAVYVRNTISLPTGILTVFVDRVMDILLLLIWSALAVVLFSVLFGKTIVSLGLLLFLLFLFIFFLWFFSNPANVKKVFKPFFNFFVPENLKEQIKLNFGTFFQSLEKLKMHKRQLFFSFCLGVISWVGSIVYFYLIVLALHIPVPFHFVLVIVPLIALSDLLPVSVSGLGTREALMIFLFSFYSLSPEQAIAVSLTYLFIGYVFPAFLGFIFMLQNPLDLKKQLKIEPIKL
ncbi:MAG: lysylphosphatidylglycerol synthase transmembrane domain-containing protein [Candidatus Diapherotrites archaeon]|nr:lysylphosphatidylglycerol synthase transmembrane domain-containing protein [Candidatus Diapherotrites archaeon]